MGGEMNPSKLILQAFDAVLKSELWQDKTPSEVLKIIMYVHSRGWLYTPIVDDKIVAVICAYRIKEVDENSLHKIPLKEEGNILYVPFAVSLTDENLFHVIREALNQYLKDNPDVTELVMDDKHDRIKRHRLKGVINGKQEQGAVITSDANVPN